MWGLGVDTQTSTPKHLVGNAHPMIAANSASELFKVLTRALK